MSTNGTGIGPGSALEAQIMAENQNLREELEEARETIRALRNGEVDALVISGAHGAEILTLQGTEKIAASVFEQAMEAIIVCDGDGRIVRASKAAHELCGHNPLLQQFDSIFALTRSGPANEDRGERGERGELTLSFDRLCSRTRLRGVEVLLRRKDGTQRHLLLGVSPWLGADGNLLGCVLILTDITALKQAEESLAEAATEARGQSQQRADFIAVLAHELRNPLAPIRNSVAAIRHHKNPEIARPCEIIERQVNHMVRMVEDLLDISRIERGKLTLRLQTIDLGAAIAHAVEICGHLIHCDGRQLIVSMPSTEVMVDADPVRLEQIISNVLCNAAKFTNQGGHIWVKMEPVELEAVITIRDDGVGISPELLPKIFTMFSQEGRAVAKGGLGIGLGLVFQLLKLHGGRIEARSAGEGKGSEFIIRLPLSRKKFDHAGENMTAKTVRRPRRVLIVEDNADSRESLSMLLSLWGHKVESAEDGQSAIAAAIKSKPEFALIDVNLPDMDGYQVAKRIRASLENNVVLVALTGYGQPEDRARATAAGFDRHLTKPADLKVLEDVFI
jgi:signal transduction histidine kinase